MLHDSPPVEVSPTWFCTCKVQAWSERRPGPIKYVKVIANMCTFTNVHMNNVLVLNAKSKEDRIEPLVL